MGYLLTMFRALILVCLFSVSSLSACGGREKYVVDHLCTTGRIILPNGEIVGAVSTVSLIWSDGSLSKAQYSEVEIKGIDNSVSCIP